MNFKLLKAISQRPPLFFKCCKEFVQTAKPKLSFKVSFRVRWLTVDKISVTAMLSHVNFVMGSFYLSWSSALLNNQINVVGFAMNLVSFKTFRNLYEVFGRHCSWVGNILNSQSCNAKNHLPTLNHLGATIGVCFRWLENGK